MSDIANLLEQAPRDCWLALDHDEKKVVGRGEDIKQAVEEANENGENDPVLIWAPKNWLPGVY